jgi:hypothetical protein
MMMPPRTGASLDCPQGMQLNELAGTLAGSDPSGYFHHNGGITVPAGVAAGTAHVTVTTSGGTSNAYSYTTSCSGTGATTVNWQY